MPVIDETLRSDNLARILAYGPAKTRKTWWATRWAEAGFNVILADIDYGFHIAQNLTPEARKRIYHLDMRAPVEDFKNSGALALVNAMQGKTTLFDEITRRYTSKRDIKPEGSYAVLNFSAMTSKDVLIVDSWTELVTHIIAADRMITNPADVPKLEWDDYGKIRLLLDLFLANMSKLNCHVIVIGHSETVGKRKKDAPAKAKPEDAIEQIRLQPMSVSRAHAETIASKFTDVLYFSVPSPMLGTMISTKGSVDFDAGSRRVAPALYKFDDLGVDKFVPAEMLAVVQDNESYSSAGCIPVTGEQLLVVPAAQGATIEQPKSALSILRRT